MARARQLDPVSRPGPRPLPRGWLRRLPSSAAGLLPPGTILVGGGTAVLGVASYVQLAAAGQTLSVPRMAGVSLLWTLVFSIGLGLFFPVEQEITRLVAARTVVGEGLTPLLRRGALLALGLLIAVVVPTAVLARPIADRLFDGEVSLVFALCGAFGALAVAHTSRGVLAGTGRFSAYGSQLALDGGLRILLSAAMYFGNVRSPLLFALILVVSPVLAVTATLPTVLREAGAGAALPWRSLCGGLVMLIPSTLLAQLLVNVSVISVKLLSPGDKAFITALLSAVVLARVPLFVFGSLQASLLRGLSAAIAAADTRAYRGLLIRAAAFTTLLGCVGGLCGIILGPWLVPALFGSPDILDAADFAWLAVGTVFYMLALILGQALQAADAHGRQLLAWGVGTAALVAVTLSPLPVRDRVEIAYAVGAAVTSAILLIRVIYIPEEQSLDVNRRQAPGRPE